MRPKTQSNQSSFLWQGTLIVLPIIALAVVGFLSLRQDRIMAEAEARERAQTLAEDLQRKLETQLLSLGQWSPTNPPNTWRTNLAELRVAFQISKKGELLLPLPIALPIPRLLPVEKLSENQLRLWQAAQSAEFGDEDKSQAVAAYRQFIATEPPDEVQPTARFALGLLSQVKDRDTALALFEEVANSDPKAATEGGLSLAQLGRLKWLELALSRADQPGAKSLAMLDTLCRDAVDQPTPLTDAILNSTESWAKSRPSIASIAQSWADIWTYDERARRLYSTAKTSLVPSKEAHRWFWLGDSIGSDSDVRNPYRRDRVAKRSTKAVLDAGGSGSVWSEDEGYLANFPESIGTNQWIVCVPAGRILRMVNGILLVEKSIPEYFGIRVNIAGRGPDDSQMLDWLQLHRSVDTRTSHSRNALDDIDISAELTRAGTGTPVVDSRKVREYSPTPPPSRIAVQEDSPAYTPSMWATNSPVSLVPHVLASAGRGNGKDLVSVAIELTNPAALLHRQRTRTVWFGSLIGFSSLAAFIGLFAAWTAFRRQERLAEMKTNFVSSASHELRAPIASVRLLAEGLERGTIHEPRKQGEYFGLIVQECRRLSSLIENILDFSRIEQGRKEYDFEPTDLVGLVRQTIKLMQPTATERRVALQLQMHEDQLATLASPPSLDGRAIQQALVNLIDNAIKHSPTDSCVTIGLEVQGGNSISLWIEDHGEGIPVEEHGRIFERFYRCGSELRRETKGVGIGLSIVKHIVEAHGGRVVVGSALGQGSRFTIELPVKACNEY